LRRTAAAIAAATPPPVSSTETAPNWAEPANVVADITIVETASKPACGARTAKDAANAAAATPKGARRRAPWR
jgi:hypothetical protein